MKGLSWINFVLGVWLIVAAFVLSSGASAVMAEEIVLGIVIAALAYASATTPVRTSAVISWIVAIAGLWTLMAPTIIGYGALRASRSNDVAIGIAVLVIGIANAVLRAPAVRANVP